MYARSPNPNGILPIPDLAQLPCPRPGYYKHRLLSVAIHIKLFLGTGRNDTASSALASRLPRWLRDHLEHHREQQ